MYKGAIMLLCLNLSYQLSSWFFGLNLGFGSTWCTTPLIIFIYLSSSINVRGALQHKQNDDKPLIADAYNLKFITGKQQGKEKGVINEFSQEVRLKSRSPNSWKPFNTWIGQTKRILP